MLTSLPPSLDAMPSDAHDIPSIAVTGSTEHLHLFTPNDDQHNVPFDDLVLRPPPVQPNRARSPSEPGFLSLPNPILRTGRNSLEAPSSPSPSSPLSERSDRSDSPLLNVPPSPTLSAHSGTSVHWATSTQLRTNRPEEHDGISSLGLLSPPASGHRRKGSNATFTSSISGSETEPDHTGESSNIALSPLLTARSDASTLASPTHTHVDSASDGGSRPGSRSSFVKKFHRLRRASRSPEGSDGVDTDTSDGPPAAPKPAKKGKGKKKRELERLAAIELEQDANKDPTPFAFKPFQLASLLDPKNIEALEDLGGVDGLLRGLGTHRTLGLGAASLAAKAGPPDHASQPVQATRKSRDIEEGSDEQVPNITITEPSGEIKGLQSTVSLGDAAQSASGGTPDAYGADMDVRKRVYGDNVLPGRKSKSLLLLMWLALKDKVLVRV